MPIGALDISCDFFVTQKKCCSSMRILIFATTPTQYPNYSAAMEGTWLTTSSIYCQIHGVVKFIRVFFFIETSLVVIECGIFIDAHTKEINIFEKKIAPNLKFLVRCDDGFTVTLHSSCIISYLTRNTEIPRASSMSAECDVLEFLDHTVV